MRVFAASLATESNPLSPLPTGLQSFQECVFFRPGEHPKETAFFGTDALWVARRRAETDRFTLIEGSCFAAMPAGITNQRDYEFMRDEILTQLAAALPLDGVLLGLHGAMIAQGYEDVEGDILERVRAIVGPKCVIGVELDPHCHLTVKRVKLADVIVLYKEYPHTDTVERAEEVIDLVLRTIRGEINPVISVYDCRQIATYLTTREPMRALVDRIKAMEATRGVLSISIAHGFPWADVPELSTRVLVITDNDKAAADTLAKQVGKELVSLRGQTAPEYCSIDKGLDAALAFNRAPVVMTDTADASGAGATADNTNFLRRLIDRGVESTALAAIWDPIAVRLCFESGEGTELALRVGGKLGPHSGDPIDAKVVVIGLKRASTVPGRFPAGDCAGIRIGGVEVVLSTHRVNTITLDVFRNVGIDPLSKKIVVIKTARPLMGPDGNAAAKMIDVDSGALQAVDFRKFPYHRVMRPIWPLDEITRPSLIV